MKAKALGCQRDALCAELKYKFILRVDQSRSDHFEANVCLKMTKILIFQIQVFVETLDKCFENVCELDLIFHMDKVSLGHFLKSFTSVKDFLVSAQFYQQSILPEVRFEPVTTGW